MSQAPLSLEQLSEVAIQAARQAGQYIQSVDRSQLQRLYKASGSSAASQLVTEVDIRSEAIIGECLQDASGQFEIAFVGEESSQTPSGVVDERLRKPYYWCVDPLDGTLPFVEGRHGYAVSIALLEQSGRPLIGVVCNPVDMTLLHAIRGQGAFRNRTPITPEKPTARTLKVFADASFRMHGEYQEVLKALTAYAEDSALDDVEVIYGSGAVRNACQVLDHAEACYLKMPRPEEGGGSIWDFSASACIVQEAGAWASTIFGQPLDLNRPDSTFMNHQGVLYASSELLARYLIDRLQNAALMGCPGGRSH